MGYQNNHYTSPLPRGLCPLCSFLFLPSKIKPVSHVHIPTLPIHLGQPWASVQVSEKQDRGSMAVCALVGLQGTNGEEGGVLSLSTSLEADTSLLPTLATGVTQPLSICSEGQQSHSGSPRTTGVRTAVVPIIPHPTLPCLPPVDSQLSRGSRTLLKVVCAPGSPTGPPASPPLTRASKGTKKSLFLPLHRVQTQVIGLGVPTLTPTALPRLTGSTTNCSSVSSLGKVKSPHHLPS